MQKSKVAIIGGGVAGITAANELSKDSRLDITILEKSEALGGLNQCMLMDGLKYDIGAFLYSDDHALMTTYPFLKEVYHSVSHAPIVITDKNKHDRHPISISGYKKNHGTTNLLLSVMSLLEGKIRYRNKKTLPDYCRYYLGDRVYRMSGLQRYIKRLYRKEDAEIDAKFGFSRISNIKRYGIRNMMRRVKKLKNDSFFNTSKKSLYVRPEEGFHVAFEILEQHLQDREVNISKGENITKITKAEDGFRIHRGAESEYYDRIISTIPFSVTQKLIGLQQKFRPSYMTLVTLCYTADMIIDSDVIYNYTDNSDWKRMTVFSKHYGKEDGRDYFSVETTITETTDNIVDICKKDFESFAKEHGIATNLDFKGSKITPFAYPVFNKGEAQIADQELQSIKNFGIDLIGRQGTFEYLSSDDTIQTTQAFIQDSFLPGLKKRTRDQ